MAMGSQSGTPHCLAVLEKASLPDSDRSQGRVMQFSASRVAVTGKDRRWGTVLYLVARGFGCTTGIELGTCAGISAMYVASAPSMGRYLTVEGSPELCEIAQESLTDHPGVTIINALFDEALDRELPALQGSVDFAFVDGHHERVATVHYTDRIVSGLSDGAIVVFDDISWSADMRRAWDELRARSDWSHAIDLGAMGVCIYRAEQQTDGSPRQWDLRQLVGRTQIGKPWGWRS